MTDWNCCLHGRALDFCSGVNVQSTPPHTLIQQLMLHAMLCCYTNSLIIMLDDLTNMQCAYILYTYYRSNPLFTFQHDS